MARFYLTTAIDYVNSRPHLGTAYEKITADVIARFKRLAGYDTHFLMGNDEHSLNVLKRARELGLEPRAYCDRMEEEFRDVWKRLEISFDDFIRTTEPRHKVSVTALLEKIRAAGDIYEAEYEGWYCVSCEGFKQEKDLEDGKCPLHDKVPQWIREKNHFFKLSKYRSPLLDHYRSHPEALEPEIRRNEIVNIIEGGLEDLSISRAGQTWGIPVPFDPDSVVYVWFDALINYISAVGFGQDKDGFSRWWPADLHIIGKDITRFHCVIWPAMLMSAGVALPRQVFGHGFVYFRGERMSKSLGTVVDPLDAAERFGPDPLRLYLVREIAYGQDGDFSWERFEGRYNTDLANNLGNLVSRVTTMAQKYRRGNLSPGHVKGPLVGIAQKAVSDYRRAMERLALQEGAAAAFRLIDATNEFLTETEPWALAKDPAAADRLSGVLYEAAEAVRIAAVLLFPVMPRSSEEILRRLGVSKSGAELRLEADAVWGSAGELHAQRGSALWPRLDRPGSSTSRSL
ncbi:MAG: methionine--tRNA ligase [Acidobacteriota bacterium]